MAPSLDQVELKLARAEKHLDALKELVLPFVASRPYEVITQFQGNEGRSTLHFIASPSPDVSTIFGDCLHNLRSSLDYIMGQLLIANGKQIDEYSPTFPIYVDPTKYRNQARNIENLIGIKTTTAPAILSGLQPYQRVDPASRTADPLWILHQLSNIDKHRALNLTVAGLFKTSSMFLHWGDPPPFLKRVNTTGVLYHGAELAVLGIGETDFMRHSMKVVLNGPVVVTLKEAGPWEHQPVEMVLEDILAHVRTIVVPAFAGFF